MELRKIVNNAIGKGNDTRTNNENETGATLEQSAVFQTLFCTIIFLDYGVQDLHCLDAKVPGKPWVVSLPLLSGPPVSGRLMVSDGLRLDPSRL